MIRNNRGSVALEAMLGIPLFIFGMLAIYDMGQAYMAEATLYEAAAETAEYMAEYGYICELDVLLPYRIFGDYIDDYDLVEKYMENGMSGVDFIGTYFQETEKNIVLVVNYTKEISLPFLPPLTKEKTFTIKQRAYVGDSESAEEDTKGESNIKVYIAENESVYHKDFECTHLKLSIVSEDISEASNSGYTKCGLCGENCGREVFVTTSGRHYHSSTSCSGLKRTIYEINIDETNGLVPCSRCGG